MNSNSIIKFNGIQIQLNWNQVQLKRNQKQIDVEGIKILLVTVALRKKDSEKTEIQKDTFPFHFAWESAKHISNWELSLKRMTYGT